MDREEYISGLATDRLQPDQVVQFLESLPERVPAGGSGKRAECRANVRRRLADLRTATGSPFPYDADEAIDDLVATFLGRVKSFGSADWDAEYEGRNRLDIARDAVGEISADLHELTIPEN